MSKMDRHSTTDIHSLKKETPRLFNLNFLKSGSYFFGQCSHSCATSCHFKICKWKGEEFLFWASVFPRLYHGEVGCRQSMNTSFHRSWSASCATFQSGTIVCRPLHVFSIFTKHRYSIWCRSLQTIYMRVLNNTGVEFSRFTCSLWLLTICALLIVKYRCSAASKNFHTQRVPTNTDQWLKLRTSTG